MTDLGRRFGWGVAALINLMLIWVVDHLLEWDLFPFLTDEFADVSPAIVLGLWVAVAANAVRVLYTRPWFVAATEIVTLAVNIWVSTRIWQVFPFEFESDVPWHLLIRTMLVIAIGGSLIGIVVQVTRLLRSDQD